MTKSIHFLALVFAISFLSSSCNTYKRYTTNAYEQNAKRGTKLAILPVRFMLTGLILERTEAEEIRNHEATESLHFQKELVARIVRKMGTGKKAVDVDLQDVQITNSKLRAAGYEIRDSYELSPKKLGEILGVDAVMIVNIESNQLFSASEARIIKTASILTDILTPNAGNSGLYIQTGSLDANASIVETESEVLLWARHTGKSSNTRKTPKDATSQLNAKLARSFPFRNQDYAW